LREKKLYDEEGFLVVGIVHNEIMMSLQLFFFFEYDIGDLFVLVKCYQIFFLYNSFVIIAYGLNQTIISLNFIGFNQVNNSNIKFFLFFYK
jgi:hypothetical protein